MSQLEGKAKFLLESHLELQNTAFEIQQREMGRMQERIDKQSPRERVFEGPSERPPPVRYGYADMPANRCEVTTPFIAPFKAKVSMVGVTDKGQARVHLEPVE